MTGYGLDIALRTGALVEGDWDLGREVPTLNSWYVLHQWKYPKASALSVRELSDLARHISCPLRQVTQDLPPGAFTLGIDWDFNVAFWGQRLSTARLAFLMGMVFNQVAEAGVVPVFISPAKVRKKLGYQAKVPKEQVWQACWLPPTASPDVKDALLLSYLTALGQKRVYDAHSATLTQTRLPGFYPGGGDPSDPQVLAALLASTGDRPSN